ncbi:PAS domain-containing hybrid sensor histidine kinase/response regulator [Propionivibrio dicarboxylicus]|uniref:Virulence sensor protein BvgS n=1 Tax=Propionivibrio dicarboxylicus TaxID=83767 RepID=A0A1G8BNW4_9RHOO|nr:PAS domain S-box protein [Propionivibrio dicarboxylicus]SDH34869.1 PAS domain S-box-containing protein [Propionivibrio dicarboxylicus]
MSIEAINANFETDTGLIHALSLSLCHSLDARKTARGFLEILCASQCLADAALWWNDPDEKDALSLLAALPTKRTRKNGVAAGHFYDRCRHQDMPRVLSAADAEFHALRAEIDNPSLIDYVALFPLCKQGLLVVFSPTRIALAPLRTQAFHDMLGRLAIALQGNLAYEKLERPEPVPADDIAQLTKEMLPEINLVLLQALIHALPNLVWFKDIHGRYLACNRRFERFIGKPAASILGRTDDELLDRDIAESFRQTDAAAIASTKPCTNEEWTVFADDGHTELLEKTKTAIHDANGQLIGVLGIGHDVTERQRTEDRSRHLASMLRLMCDNVPDMIWAKDLNKNYLFANKALCCDLLNAVDVREPMGKTDIFFAERERIRHPENAEWHTFGELCQDSDAITLENGKPSVFIESGNVKGEHLCLEVHKSPFVAPDGEILGTVGCARNITERRRIEDELEEHRQHLEELVDLRTNALLETELRASYILQSTADGLYGVGVDGAITFINPAACRMLGVTEKDAIGKNAHMLFHHQHADGSPYPAEECRIGLAVARGEALRCNNEVYWHADGYAIPVMSALHPTSRNGEITGAVISFVDITEQRAAEQAREKALLVAENLARVKSQFLANMSHEIRTPLNGVIGFAQIGLRTFADAEKSHNAFSKILASGNRLLGIVNDVLDFSKIEAGKLSVAEETVVLADVIGHAIELIAERAHGKKLQLIVDQAPSLPAACSSDALRLEQVLLNLLSNAVKFTEAGHIRLSTWREDDWLHFSITDTGIGIAEDEIDSIFNPFHQADGSATRRFDGTGLGLAICKHILELMGGNISARSQPGVGSTFQFSIPFQAAAPAFSAPPEACGDDLGGLSILAVEDDATSAALLEYNLREDGATIVLVSNGVDAVNTFRDVPPNTFDLVLMDIQMPQMDGYEATRQIKRLAPELPVIGQSAHVFGKDKAQCFASGMDAHIAKPIDFTQLRALIREQTRNRRSEEKEENSRKEEN